MKSIIIKPSNKSAIAAALASVQGKAEVNCESFDSLENHAADAEGRAAKLGLRTSERVGAQYSYVPAGPAARSYGYAQGATSITLVRRPTWWALKAVARTKVYPRNAMRRVVTLTEEQKHALVLRYAVVVGLLIDLSLAREMVMRGSATAARAAAALVLSGAVAVKPLCP